MQIDKCWFLPSLVRARVGARRDVCPVIAKFLRRLIVPVLQWRGEEGGRAEDVNRPTVSVLSDNAAGS